jgi:pimeloyl-ACP methyl ester carboxylesterase
VRASVSLIIVGLVGALHWREAPAETRSDDPERTVCGALLERIAFTVWSAAAGESDGDAWRRVSGASPVSHLTRDGRELHGFRVSPAAGPEPARRSRGFVLFVQGNAMLADQVLDELAPFAARGLEAYVYDYRGYGRSQGRRRLAAIVEDYREIFAGLSADTGGAAYLYGVSFGGLIVLNVIGRGASFERAVVDSTPSRLSHYGCPESFDPVRNLPEAASSLLIVSGGRDSVVSASEQAELRASAEARGARVVLHPQFAHSFMDHDPAVRAERHALVHDFLE